MYYVYTYITKNGCLIVLATLFVCQKKEPEQISYLDMDNFFEHFVTLCLEGVIFNCII